MQCSTALGDAVRHKTARCGLAAEVIRSKWRGDDSNGISSFPLFFSSAFLLLCFSLLFSAFLRFSPPPKIAILFLFFCVFFCVRLGRNYLMSLSLSNVVVNAVVLIVLLCFSRRFLSNGLFFFIQIFSRKLSSRLGN